MLQGGIYLVGEECQNHKILQSIPNDGIPILLVMGQRSVLVLNLVKLKLLVHSLLQIGMEQVESRRSERLAMAKALTKQEFFFSPFFHVIVKYGLSYLVFVV